MEDREAIMAMKRALDEAIAALGLFDARLRAIEEVLGIEPTTFDPEERHRAFVERTRSPKRRVLPLGSVTG